MAESAGRLADQTVAENALVPDVGRRLDGGQVIHINVDTGRSFHFNHVAAGRAARPEWRDGRIAG